MRNYVIKRSAAKKAGEIFGFDIKTITEEMKKEELKAKEKEMRCITEENDTSKKKTPTDETMLPPPKISTIKSEKEKEEKVENGKKEEDWVEINKQGNEEINEEELEKKKQEIEKDSKKKIKIGYAASMLTGTVTYSTSFARVFLEIGGAGLVAVSLAFSFIGSAIGVGLGGFIMYRHCEQLLDQFETLFIANADRLSDSLVVGVNYLKEMAKLYKKLEEKK